MQPCLKTRLIHTGLQPGAETDATAENRLNGFRRFPKETVETVLK
jgi:hypothetical protein